MLRNLNVFEIHRISLNISFECLTFVYIDSTHNYMISVLSMRGCI